jgi:hypothetical protein
MGEESSSHQESPVKRGGFINKLALNQSGVTNSANMSSDQNGKFYQNIKSKGGSNHLKNHSIDVN